MPLPAPTSTTVPANPVSSSARRAAMPASSMGPDARAYRRPNTGWGRSVGASAAGGLTATPALGWTRVEGRSAAGTAVHRSSRLAGAGRYGHQQATAGRAAGHRGGRMSDTGWFAYAPHGEALVSGSVAAEWSGPGPGGAEPVRPELADVGR